MTLSRWRRVVTGVAAGVIVLCAALVGASFRDDGASVAVAADLRPTNIIPIEEDPVVEDPAEDVGAEDADEVIITDDADLPDTSEPDTSEPDSTEPDADPADALDPDAGDPADAASDPAQVIDPDDLPSDDTASEDTASDDTASDDTAEADTPAADTPPVAAEPAQPLTAADDALGTGGGVDDAECALDRLVIYAGARVGGVAGSLRAALAQAGFAADCPAPVTVLASNCPLQFSGVLGAGAGYDPATPFVASSASVDRETMTAVMGSVGYTGNEINILDFSFVNPDKPGEQWMAIFIPPSFAGWEDLAARAGLNPSTNSLCAASGELAG